MRAQNNHHHSNNHHSSHPSFTRKTTISFKGRQVAIDRMIAFSQAVARSDKMYDLKRVILTELIQVLAENWMPNKKSVLQLAINEFYPIRNNSDQFFADVKTIESGDLPKFTSTNLPRNTTIAKTSSKTARKIIVRIHDLLNVLQHEANIYASAARQNRGKAASTSAPAGKGAGVAAVLKKVRAAKRKASAVKKLKLKLKTSSRLKKVTKKATKKVARKTLRKTAKRVTKKAARNSVKIKVSAARKTRAVRKASRAARKTRPAAKKARAVSRKARPAVKKARAVRRKARPAAKRKVSAVKRKPRRAPKAKRVTRKSSPRRAAKKRRLAKKAPRRALKKQNQVAKKARVVKRKTRPAVKKQRPQLRAKAQAQPQQAYARSRASQQLKEDIPMVPVNGFRSRVSANALAALINKCRRSIDSAKYGRDMLAIHRIAGEISNFLARKLLELGWMCDFRQIESAIEKLARANTIFLAAQERANRKVLRRGDSDELVNKRFHEVRQALQELRANLSFARAAQETLVTNV